MLQTDVWCLQPCGVLPFKRLPNGLVGIKCTANVTIGEREVDCLLETVPQATTIPQSFYESNLSDFPLKQLENLLAVEGANGLAVPFLGYIELTPKFPNAFLVSEV